MKRHWIKKIILLLAIVLLSTAGYLVYLFQFKEYDVADEEVDEITKEEYKVELPDGSTVILDKEGNIVEDADSDGVADTATAAGSDSVETNSAGSSQDAADKTADSTSGTSNQTASSASGTAGSSSDGTSSKAMSGTSGSGSGGSKTEAAGSTSGSGSASSGTGSSDAGSSSSGTSGSGDSNGSTDKSDETLTVAQIKAKYEPALADVEAQANARISGLVNRAKNEYTTKKANGESINYSYFYSKYTAAAAELENRTDSVFYAVLGSMKRELKANGLAESHADSLVTEYENRKEQRKSALMKQATGF